MMHTHLSNTIFNKLTILITLVKQIEEEMTPEEKKKLYKAIDYQENAAPAVYPEDYVDNSMAFLLRSLEIELLDDNNKKFQRVLFTHLRGVKVKLSTRVAASALGYVIIIFTHNTIQCVTENATRSKV